MGNALRTANPLGRVIVFAKLNDLSGSDWITSTGRNSVTVAIIAVLSVRDSFAGLECDRGLQDALGESHISRNEVREGLG